MKKGLTFVALLAVLGLVGVGCNLLNLPTGSGGEGNGLPTDLTSLIIEPGKEALSVIEGYEAIVKVIAITSDGSVDSLEATSSDTTVATVSVGDVSASAKKAGDRVRAITIEDIESTHTVVINGVASGSATITLRSGSGLSSDIEVAVLPDQTTLTLSKYSSSITVGSSDTITVIATKADGSADDIVAVSDKPFVASVSVSGSKVTINGVASGSATITVASASGSGKAASISVTVVSYLVLSLDKTSSAIVVGGTDTITATAKKANGSADTVTAVSADSNVASVSVSGNAITITGVSIGSTTITVTSGSGLTASITVTVNPATALILNPTALTIGIGGVRTISITATKADGSSDTIEFVSNSNPGVATASLNGTTITVTGKAIGNTVISVGSGSGLATSVYVTVANLPSLTVEKTSVSVEAGKSVTVTVSALNINGLSDSITVNTSSGVVATASVSGGTMTINGWSVGSTTITLTSSSGKVAAISVTVTPTRPDLIVVSVDGPASANRGDSITITYTVKNQGSVSTGGYNFDIHFYLSTDTTITTSDIQLGYQFVSGSSGSGLGAGETASGTMNVSIPASVASGSYYVGAIVDRYNYISEVDEFNNAGYDATPINVTSPNIDLIVESIDGPTSGGVGSSITIAYTVKNQGTVSVNSSFYIRFYLSTDTTITTSDIYLGENYSSSGLSSGATSSGTTTYTSIPTSVTPGSYYIGAIVDSSSSVPETNETNNTGYDTTQITVSKADLIVVSVDGPTSANRGGSATIAYTIKNQGSATASPTYSGFDVFFYLSTDTTITTSDTQIGYSSLGTSGSLSPGATISGTTIASIPASVASGSYYIGAILDRWNYIPETDETNNTGYDATPTNITTPDIDLIVESVDGPTSGGVGSPVTITYTVKNQGTVSANSNFYGIYVRFYLSTDTAITTSDTYLGESYLGSTLNAGATSSGTTTYTSIPTSVTPGSYYIGVIVDSSSYVPEIDETNNTGYDATQITVAKSDLIVVSVDGPTSANRSGSATIAYTLKNQGSATAALTYGSFDISFYLSTDTAITTSDTYLGYDYLSSGLSAGATTSRTVNVTIPTSITPGSYYIGVIVDRYNYISESDETNNTGHDATPTNITTPDIDLIVVSVDAPTSANSGSSITVAYTVKNQGSVAAGSFNIRFYGSTNTIISTEDYYLGSSSVSGLAAGATLSGERNVYIYSSGTYYIGAIVDSDNSISETNETNNTGYDATPIVVP